MLREIITIDQKKCDGCGNCVPGCPEGAIQMIDGKARLISDLFCDGLGACIGHCPQGAITIEKREAEPYDERQVMANIIPQGENTIKAHLLHLQEHGEVEFLKQAIEILKESGIDPRKFFAEPAAGHHHHGGGCPGSQSRAFHQITDTPAEETTTASRPSQLAHWPVQMHLISPRSPHYANSDLLLAADCVAFSMGDFHKDYLKGRTLAIACPKLDSNQEIYLEKLVSLIDDAKINTITVMIMQVPCCGGLMRMAQMAVQKASRRVPVKMIVVGVQGDILQEDWV